VFQLAKAKRHGTVVIIYAADKNEKSDYSFTHLGSSLFGDGTQECYGWKMRHKPKKTEELAEPCQKDVAPCPDH
jgi:hypothetical protein